MDKTKFTEPFNVERFIAGEPVYYEGYFLEFDRFDDDPGCIYVTASAPGYSHLTNVPFTIREMVENAGQYAMTKKMEASICWQLVNGRACG